MAIMEPIKSSQHPDKLLPWLANNTLAGAERVEVEAHVASCERCRRELAYLESLRGSIADMENVPGPGEFGLNRLLQDVRRQPRHAQRRRWLAPALAASLAVIVLQGVMLAQMWMHPANIVPLGRELQDADVLQIRFEPRATEADIRSALQAVGANVIDGPGALGIYRVRLEPGVSGKSMEVSRAIAMLEARHGVVVQIIAESRRATAPE
jgi:hypothetical protein